MNKIIDWFAENAGFGLTQRLGWKNNYNKLIKLIKYYKDVPRLSSDEITRIQVDLLRKLLTHAGEEVPYYKRVFKDAGFEPESISGIGDLKDLPVLSRTNLQTSLQELKSADASERGAILNHTGGSTGSPVSFYQCNNYRLHNTAAKIISDSIAGKRNGSRTAILWGSREDIRGAKSPKGKLYELIRNERYYSAYNMSTKHMFEYYRSLQSFRPTVLMGYAEALNLFAEYLDAKNLKPTFPTIGIISSAGTLFPDMRRRIEDTFSVPVFDRYGSREIGLIAFECCEHSGLHVNSLGCIVELEPIDTDTDCKKILVTSLHNYAMPMIRYEIGDTSFGWADSCECGRNTPMLKGVSGRITSMIKTSDGKFIYGGKFRFIVLNFPEIKCYQFEQTELERFNLLIVPEPDFSKDVLPDIKNAILQEVGSQCMVKVDIVDSIPPTKSGKHLFTISRLKAEFPSGTEDK